jgi:hypothetical protein
MPCIVIFAVFHVTPLPSTTTYSTAIELSPNNAVYYNNRGAALYDLERYDEAIDDYSKAVEVRVIGIWCLWCFFCSCVSMF